ncbi:MAG: DUF4838 domain-containing protein [Terrimicrobiaceae bacterium]
MSKITRASAGVALATVLSVSVRAAEPEMFVAQGGKTEAVVVVAPDAGMPEVKGPDGQMVRGRDEKGLRNAEWLAAADLVRCIGLMTGARPRMASTREEITEALKGTAPVFLVGEEALAAKPAFAARIRARAKPNPVLRADAIGVLREGNRVYLAGNHDEAHYYAVSTLLQKWGCRWYMPTDFGECLPERPTLTVGALDEVYAPPFEVRKYWISWLGAQEPQPEFRLRNFMNYDVAVPSGHSLATYTKELIPDGKTCFNVPIAEESTAIHVAGNVANKYAKGERFSLSMEDGIYVSDSPKDKELKALQFDKYFMQPSMTDCFMVFYNRVARILREQYPQSKSKIGFLAYSNITLPPVQGRKAEPSLVAYLAPIDIDPIHGMDNPQSPPRQEYRDMVYRWAKVMEGRVVIYDYDQGMLCWRDIPNPSIQGLQEDFRHYVKAGILGVDTESRGAIGTTFINLHCRAQLLWDPGVKLEALLAEFYPKFYGPAAEPMAKYWGAIYDAWKNTLVTEHEHFVAPAIYTPELLAEMRKQLDMAETLVKPLREKKSATSREKQFLDRMAFTRLSFEVTDNYLAMVRAAAAECDYSRAASFGEKGLAAREQLADMNRTFTTYRRKIPNPIGMEENGPAWWPGEVQQYRDLQQRLAGVSGTLIKKLPLKWAFRRDPKDLGLKEGWGLKAPDLAFWNENGTGFTSDTRKDYPVTEWEILRTDLYLQAQGVRHPDRQSYAGHGWYAVEMEMKPEEVRGAVRMMFPGLFNECWLYVNGKEAAHREKYAPLWWNNDYKFEWDVDLSGRLQPGTNLITLRIYNPHHYGGMFRRPFLYQPSAKSSGGPEAP